MSYIRTLYLIEEIFNGFFVTNKEFIFRVNKLFLFTKAFNDQILKHLKVSIPLRAVVICVYNKYTHNKIIIHLLNQTLDFDFFDDDDFIEIGD